MVLAVEELKRLEDTDIRDLKREETLEDKMIQLAKRMTRIPL